MTRLRQTLMDAQWTEILRTCGFAGCLLGLSIGASSCSGRNVSQGNQPFGAQDVVQQSPTQKQQIQEYFAQHAPQAQAPSPIQPVSHGAVPDDSRQVTTAAYEEVIAPADDASAPPFPAQSTPLGSIQQLAHTQVVVSANGQPTEVAHGTSRGDEQWPQVLQVRSTPTTAPQEARLRMSEFLPADRRVELPTTTIQRPQSASPASHWAQGDSVEIPRPVRAVEVYSDEYLYDGGDRAHPAQHYRDAVSGLETEDTVAEYTDHTGEKHVEASNRVAVYAPRFAAVRTASQPQERQHVQRATGTHDGRGTQALDAQLAVNTNQEYTGAQGMNVRSRPNGLDGDLTQFGVHKIQQVDKHIKLNNIFEDRQFNGQWENTKTNGAGLLASIQAAARWTRDQSPIVVANNEEGQEVYSIFQVEQYIGVEDQNTPGRLKIVKTADKNEAKPGEEIAFTIRFENTGDKPLYDVVVLDNLTPRLEFIEGSADSELPGDLIVEENSEGSLILKFRIEGEVAGHSTASVSFRCRVR